MFYKKCTKTRTGLRLYTLTIGPLVRSGPRFIAYRVFVTLGSRSSRVCLTITLTFTLDVASRAYKHFSITFAAQWRERTSRAKDSRGARTLTNNLQRGIYLGAVFIMDRRAFEKALRKTNV